MGQDSIGAVYAPNNHKLRLATLWQELIVFLDKNRSWIVVGDYNMVETLEDRRGGSGNVLRGIERRAWNGFKKQFCLEDSHMYKKDFLNYSLDSKRIQRHNPWVQN